MKNTLSCLSLALLSTFAFLPPVSAEDWTEFRGPDGQGISQEESLPLTWSETENVRWKVPVEGDGWSSPVVADGRIYLTSAVPIDSDADNARSLRVICLSADDGSRVWEKEVFRQPSEGIKIHKKNSHASPTPVLSDDRVYVHFGPSGTACLTTDGEIAWKNDQLKFNPTHGNGGSPALFQDTLLITCDGADEQYVAGLSAETGQVKWRTDRKAEVQKGFSFSTPTLIEVNGRTQAVCPGSGAVVAYDPETGEELWSVSYGEGYSVVPRPVFSNGTVFLSSGYNSASLYAIDPTGHGDVTDTHVRWIVEKGVPKTPSMLALGDEIYFVDDGGVASCLDTSNGQTHWQKRLGGKFSASVFYGGGRLYFLSEDGTTTVIEPGTTFKKLATNEIGAGDRTFASLAVVGEDLLLRSETHLYRIGQ